ncbi:MAG: hypothetical protein C0391_03945 [Anaerolinea sp.]|nr:hypothetical protein [Anaerolinea sp.]
MASRLTIYDRNGRLIAELDASVKRSWIKNRAGVASFSTSTLNEKCREEYLRYGNLVLVEHDKLPAWGGYITTNREWENGLVKVNARGIMGRFADRWGVGVCNFAGSPGYALENFINKANEIDDTRMRVGELSRYGVANIIQVQRETKMYDFITAMIDEFRGYLLEFSPSFDEGRALIFKGNWYKQPEGTSQTVLMEGLNIEAQGSVLVEQGTIANRMHITSNGATEKDKKSIHLDDEESKAKYGLYELAETSSVSTTYVQTPFEETAREKLAKMKQPRKLYNFKVLDIESAWYETRIGAQFRCELYSSGFFGSGLGSVSTVRVIGMSFSDEGRLELACEETE